MPVYLAEEVQKAMMDTVSVAMETESDKVNSYQDWNEEEEVKKFLHDNVTNYGLMILMRDYLFRVAEFEKCQWYSFMILENSIDDM